MKHFRLVWLCALLALPLIAGCGMFPSEPLNAPVGLRRSGDDYFLQFAGSCDYPAGTSVSVRLGDGSDLFQVTLKAGSTTNEIRIGDVTSAQHIGLAFAGFPGGQQVIDVLAGARGPQPGWSNEFTIPIADGTMNGGTEFDNQTIDRQSLDAAALC